MYVVSMTDINDIDDNNPMSPRKTYAQIAIPQGLREEIEKLLEELQERGIDLGYTGVPEFIRDAIRRLIVQVRENHIKK